MNFGTVIKKEIISRPIKERHCIKAFLSGLLRGSGTLYEKEGEIGLDFTLSDEGLMNTVSNYFVQLFGYVIREVSVAEDRLNKKDRFIVSLCGDGVSDMLTELGILNERDNGLEVNFDFYGELTKKECCLHAFMRGLFVAAGGCTVPDFGDENGTGYHLELVFFHPRPAALTCEKLLESGIRTKITRRKESYLVYIKSAEGIKDFIAFLPAPVSVLKLTDIMINKEITNNSNRQKNCDLGNVNRQIEAVAKYSEAIAEIEKSAGLSSLKADLKETAEARVKYPEDTLSELAERLGITKSCLNHRMRKIVSIAEQLHTKE